MSGTHKSRGLKRATHVGDARLDGLHRPLQQSLGQIVRLLVQVLSDGQTVTAYWSVFHQSDFSSYTVKE